MSNNTSENKRDAWLRYGFWITATMLAAVAIFVLVIITTKSENTALNVPADYKFVIEDHYPVSDATWATYYVYDSYILVRKDSESAKGEPMVIYDGIDSSKLVYDENDTVKICDTDSCYHYPKVLLTIKKIMPKKPSREYTGQ